MEAEYKELSLSRTFDVSLEYIYIYICSVGFLIEFLPLPAYLARRVYNGIGLLTLCTPALSRSAETNNSIRLPVANLK